MASDQNTPTRWRPRFSVRTLVVIVTLVCAYAACWGPTKNRGWWDVLNASGSQPDVIAPLLLRTYDLSRTGYAPGGVPIAYPKRQYYFWFFGYVVKLYESELPVTSTF